MATVKGTLLCLVVILELGAVTWCALWPLRDELAALARARGWWERGNFTLGNLDVMLLAFTKDLTLLVLVTSTPTRTARRSRRLDALLDGANHGVVRRAISVLCGLHAAFLLVKAAAVAVNAPPQLWPSSGDVAGNTSIGLVFLYVSIVVSLVASLVSQGLGPAVVSEREDAWEEQQAEDEEATDSLRAPLLAASATTTTGGGTRAADDATQAAAADGKPTSKAAEAAKGAANKAAAAKRKQRTLIELLRLAFVDWPLLLVAFTAGSLAALGSASLAYLTGQMVDFASIELDRSRFTHTTLLLLLMAGLTALFTGTRGGLFTIANTRLNVRLRKSLFHALLQMEIGFFDTNRTGEIISRLAADTSTVADQVGLNMNVMLRSATQAAMVLFFMFAASWRLTVVTFILVPVVLTISQVYGKFYSKLSKRVQAELATANAVADEVLSTMTTVKAHAIQDSAEAAYAAKLKDFYKLQLLEAGAYALYAILNTFLPNVVTAVVLFYGGNLVLAGVMSRGALVSFMLYQQSLTSAFQLMGDVFSALTAAVGAADKVVELMRRQPAIPPGGHLVLPSLEGRVEVQEVVFQYPARPDVQVLNGLSLVAHPGEVVALVGPSGGGKSSVIKLLERFYLPSSGRIVIDGHDLGQFNPKWLRRQVALVSQEPVLYARSIRRNIILGLEPEDGCTAAPSEEEVVEAAKQANAHDFITSFPEGYETSCGEKGVALSGGQKQRIAIARALVRKPRVLLLDEATSALDADSEAVVQEALDRVMHGRTVIVIAHRLSTIQAADRIYVIGKGVVQEVGTHNDLLAAGGVYSQLVRRQLTRPMSQVNLLGGSSADLRPSVSTTSLSSLVPEDNSSNPQPQQQLQPTNPSNSEQQQQQQSQPQQSTAPLHTQIREDEQQQPGARDRGRGASGASGRGGGSTFRRG
ncbi:hypothetical protein Vretimale_16209 [Volvox reticuliferus]|uniref:Uncharacterized protein n=1 Tax=Volvox reticuliferus TaxID=1737510 RepID=A0A8J4GT32_9CHLO|nr:hypothetical protein Vretifemale_16941 [Volvox reticuliferus]GIM13014.1 hypothetical protein Vretimale_16209 [Volvox reticuliferus]